MIPIDLHHDGLPGAICVYLLEIPEPALVDPGPASSLPDLREGLAAHGYRVEDLRHLLLTHVHLDHAGGAGELVRENPRLAVHIHADGAPHMADPDRLVASTRRTFGEAHDRLWGEVIPIPRERIHAWSPGDRSPFPHVRAIPSPGHTGHHVAWLEERDGILFAGDSLGIILAEEAPTHPATPPPGLDVRAWEATLETIRGIGPERAAVTHFGVHGDVFGRVESLRERLQALEARVRAVLEPGEDAAEREAPARDAAARAEEAASADQEAYEEEVRAEQGEHRPREEVDRYFDAFSAATDWAGMRRFVERNPPAPGRGG